MTSSLSRICLFAGALLMTAVSAKAQFTETEPNSAKAEATVVNGIAAGGTIMGLSTGGIATPGDTADTSADFYRVKTAALPLGIYRHRLVITTTGAAGHTGNILGLTQTAGVPNTAQAIFQQSLSTTTPARAVTWYGFGKQEEIYFVVAGTATTTSPYTVTMTTDAIAPYVVGGCFVTGSLTIQTVGLTTTDTDTWVYDSNLDPIVGYGNDDEPSPGVTLQSKLTRTFAPGTYYYVLSQFETGSNLGSPLDDSFQSGLVMDFPGVLCHSSSTNPQNLRFSITDGTTTTLVPATKTGPFEVAWAQFTVSASPCAVSSGSQYCFGDNSCPCSNNTPVSASQGCAHGIAGGATLSSTGVAKASADSLVLTATNLPFPPGGTGSILFFQGTTAVNTAFNDGKRCAGGTVVRLGLKLHGSFSTTASYPSGADPLISIRGGIGTPIAPGSSRFYQGQYRTVPGTGCSTNSNLTNGVAVVWIP